LQLGKYDRLSAAEDSALRAGEVITIQRVEHRIVTRIDLLPFKVTKRSDSSLRQGVTKIIRPGKKGRERNTYALVYIDGKIAGRTLMHSVVLSKPQNEVERVGTMLAPTAAAPSPGTAQAIARDLIGQYGWDSSQFDCLVVLWNSESGWNVHAANPSTGAYGIPQALPGDKMSTAGPDWQNNATTQIKWGLGYINERYGTPCNAWSYWQANGWY
jgi:hypothetical protein